jgi:hypothetical protein
VAAPSAPARRDISAQQRSDRDQLNWQDTLIARMGAVLQAQEERAGSGRASTTPVDAREADFTFRQSLIDLASIAELIADELPPPVV